MNNLNSVLVEGNLIKDPESRTTPKGTLVSTFSIATNRFYKQDSNIEKEVSFFNVQAWSRLAETASNLGRKGQGVRVVGRLKQERWNDSQGNSQSKIIIVAEHLEFKPDFQKESLIEEKFEAYW